VETVLLTLLPNSITFLLLELTDRGCPHPQQCAFANRAMECSERPPRPRVSLRVRTPALRGFWKTRQQITGF